MNHLIAGIALATFWAAAQWNRDLHTTEVARFPCPRDQQGSSGGPANSPSYRLKKSKTSWRDGFL